MTTTAVDDQFASDPEQPPSGQSAAPTDAIYDAIDILMSAADDLRECHTLASAPDDWTGEDEAKAEYDRILRCVAALRAQPAAATPDEIEGLRAHVALLKSALAQAERENDELRRAQPAAATVTTDAQAIRDAALEEAAGVLDAAWGVHAANYATSKDSWSEGAMDALDVGAEDIRRLKGNSHE